MKKLIGFRMAVFATFLLIFTAVVAVFTVCGDRLETANKTSYVENCVRVFVSGAVKNAGVVTAEPGVSLYDAAAECGFCENAYIDENLKTSTALDGDEVYIMTTEEYQILLSSPPVDINTATETELQKLPGIGQSFARRIIDYRETNGNFKSPQEIMLVPGIAQKKYNNLKLFITVSQED